MPATQAPNPAPRTYTCAVDLASRFTLRSTSAVRLHPRSTQNAQQLDAKCSKLGGPFAWPSSQPWPKCEEHDFHYLFLLQLRREDVPELPFRGDEDLLQVFACCCDHEDTGGMGVNLIWKKVGSLQANDLQVNAISEELNDDCDYIMSKPRECCFHPERIVELVSDDPQVNDAVDEWLNNSEEGEREFDALGIPRNMRQDSPFYYHFSAAPGIKVNGYPWAMPDPIVLECEGCEQNMSLMLQISMDNVGNGESAYRWLASDVARLPSGEVPSFGGIEDDHKIFVYTCNSCEQRVTRAVYL